MSGGGGSGEFVANPWAGAPGSGAVGGGGDNRGRGACETLTFQARLRNVDADELASAAEGDRLKVEYRSDPSPTVGVFRMLPSGLLAPTQLGALSERLGELLPCLQQLDFVAVLDKIDGGDTRVTVRPA